MEKYIIFTKPHNHWGGVKLETNSVYHNDAINSMSVEERLALVAKKVLTGKTWASCRERLTNKGEVRYQDLPLIPDGLFYDCGLTRTTLHAPVTSYFVEPDAPIKGAEE